MEYTQDFFKAEVINGFTVSSLMKRCWAAQTEVLKQFDEICRRLGIHYYLGDGTLLGAVRHKGFIPWDDDIDVWMLRDELDRFISISKEELDKCELELVTPFSDKNYNNLAFRLINTRGICLDEKFLMKYWMFPFMAGLDIFPLDYVPRDAEQLQTMMTLATCANVLGKNWRDESIRREEKMETYRQIIGVLAVREVAEDQIENELCRLTDRICAMYKAEDADQITNIPEYSSNPNKIFNKEWFGEGKMIEFQGRNYPCPKEPDAVLRAAFGADYMIPQNLAGAHGYPYYRRAHQMLLRMFEEKGLSCPVIYKEL